MKRKKMFIIVITASCLIIIIGAVVVRLLSVGSPLWLMIKLKDKKYQPITITAPAYKMPVPNAFDTFVQAGKALVDTPKIKELFPRVRDASPDKLSSLAPEMRTLVVKNKHALTLWRQGLAQSYRSSTAQLDNASRVFLMPCHNFAKLIYFNSRCQAIKGDWQGATRDALDLIQFGSTIPHGGMLLDGIMGCTIEKEGRLALRPCLSRLDAQQTQEVMRRLTKASLEQLTAADLLQQELDNAYAFSKAEMLAGLSTGPDKPTIEEQQRMVLIMLDPYVRYMQRRITNARLPYAKQKRIPESNDVMTSVLATRIDELELYITKNQAQQDILLLECALHAYYLEHARYPTSLNKLTPTYLAKIPNDPFAHQGSYLYHPRKKGYLLYSVGPDSRDDGGKPLVYKGGKSWGDIIAGTE